MFGKVRGKVLGNVIHVFAEQECRVIKYAVLQQLKKENSDEKRRDRDVVYFAKSFNLPSMLSLQEND